MWTTMATYCSTEVPQSSNLLPIFFDNHSWISRWKKWSWTTLKMLPPITHSKIFLVLSICWSLPFIVIAQVTQTSRLEGLVPTIMHGVYPRKPKKKKTLKSMFIIQNTITWQESRKKNLILSIFSKAHTLQSFPRW